MRFKILFTMVGCLAACASSQDPGAKGANRGEDPVLAWQRVHPSDDLNTPAESQRNPTKTIAKHSGSNPCQEADVEAEELWTRATSCKSDTECNHYPSTCSAVGNNAAADELVDLDNWRNKNCDREPNAFCGATTPYCDKGRCATRKVPAKFDRK